MIIKAVPDAKLLGLRLTAQPLPYLELGASRVLQWGGEGRSESLSSLWNAIKGNDNFDSSDQDKSNQIAGFDGRLSLQPLLDVPVSLLERMRLADYLRNICILVV